MKHKHVVVAVFSIILLAYFGPLAPQFVEWLGESRVYLIATMALAASSDRDLYSKVLLSATFASSCLLLATLVGDDGTLINGGVWGDWLLFHVLDIYSKHVQGLNGLYAGCLLIMFTSVMLLIGGVNRGR